MPGNDTWCKPECGIYYWRHATKTNPECCSRIFFFLAVPTMLAATGYKLLKHYTDTGGFTAEEIKLLADRKSRCIYCGTVGNKIFYRFFKKIWLQGLGHLPDHRRYHIAYYCMQTGYLQALKFYGVIIK